ncbi:hypothetical protein RCL1_006244 [Eukaryota sp. TZLM3-RCL]
MSLPSLPTNFISLDDLEAKLLESTPSQESAELPPFSVLQRPQEQFQPSETSPTIQQAHEYRVLFTESDTNIIQNNRRSTVILTDPYQEDYYYINTRSLQNPPHPSLDRQAKPNTTFVQLPPSTFGCIALCGSAARPVLPPIIVPPQKAVIKTFTGLNILIEKIYDYLIELNDLNLIGQGVSERRSKLIMNISKHLRLPYIPFVSQSDFVFDTSIFDILLQSEKGQELLIKLTSTFDDEFSTEMIDFRLLIAMTVVPTLIVNCLSDKIITEFQNFYSNFYENFASIIFSHSKISLVNFAKIKLFSILNSLKIVHLNKLLTHNFFFLILRLLVSKSENLVENSEILDQSILKFSSNFLLDDVDHFSDSHWTLLTLILTENKSEKFKNLLSPLEFSAQCSESSAAQAFVSTIQTL